MVPSTFALVGGTLPADPENTLIVQCVCAVGRQRERLPASRWSREDEGGAMMIGC